MPRIMYKPRPDRDEYVIWSTVVDLPVSGVMDRDTAKATWASGECSIIGTPISDADAEKSMQRADATGWSISGIEAPVEAMFLCLGNLEGYPGDYEHGTCNLTDLAAVTRAIEHREWATLENLLTDLTHWEDDE